MSQERHPNRYQPEHRSKRGNKQRRGTKWNGGSKFDHLHARVCRLIRRRLMDQA